jgi:hypothetical protein
MLHVLQDYESARLLISYGLRETAKWAAPPASVAAATAAAAAAAPEFATPGRVLRPSGSSSSSSGATPGRSAGAVPLPSPGGLTGVAAAAGAVDMAAVAHNVAGTSKVVATTICSGTNACTCQVLHACLAICPFLSSAVCLSSNT